MTGTKTGVEISLSIRRVGNLPCDVHENDFIFIVGDDRYDCPFFIVSFIFPRISPGSMKDTT
jgi:hypothetical protein